MPGRFDGVSFASPRVVLTEKESKLLAKYAVPADHLVTAPPPPIMPDVAKGVKHGEFVQTMTQALKHLTVDSDTASGSSISATGTDTWSMAPGGTRAPVGFKALESDDAPTSHPKRKALHNKHTLAPSPETDTAPSSTSFNPRYPGNNIRPSLMTLEKVASNALYFEQYYDSLAAQTATSSSSRLRKWQRRRHVTTAAFDFGRVIGQGAFGVVRIAKEKRNGRIVAVKQLSKVALLRMGHEGHVRAEKNLLSSAYGLPTGPSWIPRLFYSFQDEDHLFLVLEYMGGGDLLTMLIQRGSLPEEMVRFYAAEMILALHQTHRLGYIHRDVKPDNFLFTSEGHIRVADFGLATDLHWAHDSAYYEHQRRAILKRHGVPLDRPAFGNRRRSVEHMPGSVAGWGDKGRNLLSWRSRKRRRMAYTICGTNSYMAPEVIRGHGYGFSVDWWGLGVIVYESLYGTIPFPGTSRQASRDKIIDWKHSLVFRRTSSISPLAVDFMKRLLCDPEDRLGYVPSAYRGLGASASTVNSAESVVCSLEGPLGPDGVEQLMAHPWFHDIDWSTIQTQTPPFRPNLASKDDTSHFDEDIPNEPLAPGNSALYLRDPLLGDTMYGPDVLSIRKALAFKGWTFCSPLSDDDVEPELTSATGETSYSTMLRPLAPVMSDSGAMEDRVPATRMVETYDVDYDDGGLEWTTDQEEETEETPDSTDVDHDGEVGDTAVELVIDSYMDDDEWEQREYGRYADTQKLNLKEMMATEYMEDEEPYARPSCVPMTTGPNGTVVARGPASPPSAFRKHGPDMPRRRSLPVKLISWQR